MECSLASPALGYLWDHIVSGRPLFPGAGFFEAAAAAPVLMLDGRLGEAALVGVSIPSPLVLHDAAGRQAAALGGSMLRVSVNVSGGGVEIRSGAVARPAVHLSGRIITSGFEDTASPAAAAAAMETSWALSDVLQYRISPASPAGCAVVVPSTHDASAHFISPAVLDNCLQLGAISHPSSGLAVPVGLQALMLMSKARQADNHHAISRPAAAQPAGSGMTSTDYGCLGNGSSSCHIASLQTKLIRPTGTTRKAAAVAAASSAAAGPDPLEGQVLYEVQWLSHSLISQAGTLAALFEPSAAMHPALELGRSMHSVEAIASAIAVAQGSVRQGPSTLSFLTSGVEAGKLAQPAESEQHAAEAAGLFALARTVAQEAVSHRIAAIDVAAALPSAHARPAFVLDELPGQQPALIKSSAYGLSLRGGHALAASLVPSALKPALPPSRLFPMPRGALQSLKPELLANTEPGAGRVMLAVKAVGINFR
jgi:hypothetical protein